MSAGTAALLTNASTTVTTSSVQVLAPGTYGIRNCLILHNPDLTKVAAVNLTGGTAAINTNGSITMNPGSTMLFDFAVPTASITAIGSSSGTPLTIYWA